MADRVKPRAASRYITTTVDVEVDIGDYLADSDDDELHELGLHRANACAGDPHGAPGELHAALTALHEQAHPDQPRFVDMCLRDPCRSLSLQRFPRLGT